LQALRSLYSLKQAIGDWDELIKAELITWGFELSLAKPCLFVNHTTGMILLVYVDDIDAAVKSKIQLKRFFETLSARFNANSLAEIEKILGTGVTRDRKDQTLYLDQEQYLRTVLNRFGITAKKHKSKIPTAEYESLRPPDERVIAKIDNRTSDE
jgi:hypothetical protein